MQRRANSCHSRDYSPFLSWAVLAAQLHFLVHAPRRYLRALGRTVWQTIGRPRDLLLALAIFPKSVYFARQMQEMGVDHVHSHFAWLQGIAAGIASDLLGIPYTIHSHAFDLFTRNPLNLRRELQSADHLVTISKYNRDFILRLCPQLGPADIDIIHCGVDCSRFQPIGERPATKTAQILSVGSLIEKKGHEYLIDACEILAGRGYEFECRIVGLGPLHQALSERIRGKHLEERIRLVGALDQAHVLQQYDSSDIFVLACAVARSKDQDGIPVALMEAMACGLPVISTPVSGIPELVRHEETGLLVPERDANAVAGALEQLMCDEVMRRRLGSRARELVLEEFEIGANASRLAAVFRSLSAPADAERSA